MYYLSPRNILRTLEHTLISPATTWISSLVQQTWGLGFPCIVQCRIKSSPSCKVVCPNFCMKLGCFPCTEKKKKKIIHSTLDGTTKATEAKIHSHS